MFGATSDFTIYNDALLASAILVKGTNSNVLIGTTTDANFKLDVNGTGRFNTSLTVGAGGLTGRLSVRGTTNDSSAFAFEAANSSGNSLFVVRNDGAATFSNLVNAGTSGTVQGQLTLFSTTANAEGNIYGRNGGGMLLNTNANAHPIEFGGSRIQFNSNVGIGTTTDNGERLQVNGSISASDQLKRYVESMNSGQTISFSLNDSGFGMRLFMISAFNNANANANIMALCMVNTRNLNFGGGNSILTIGTTQNSTGTSGEISSLGYSIGGSGTALTLNVTASLASGSGTIQIRVQEIKWVG